MVEVRSFEDAVSQVEKEPVVLLGNGFSIAWDAKAFSYGHLLDRADFSGMSCAANVLFAELGTTDFEVVIERLKASELIVRLYDSKSGIPEKAAADAELLRDALASALASAHPETVASLPDRQYASVRAFLARFKCVYTVNYDLLLYWATMKDDGGLKVPSGDGFRDDPDDPDATWVTWDMSQSWSQQIHYLHGALHLFDAGDRLKKLTWVRTQVPLVDQIREQLAERSYPLVVTEGTSAEKKDKIMHSAYLSKAFRSFAATTSPLFTYGLSLAENDEHILDAIVRGKVPHLFVSVYGDPQSLENQALMQRAALLSERRADHVTATERRTAKTLEVHFYDASSAQVWDGGPAT